MKGNAVDSKFLDLTTNLIVASCIRIGLIIYGLIQDQLAAVKYTDIDYMVFSDAARFVSEGQSPYLRATFRYTPLIAWLLQPNLLFGSAFGKVLFSSFDILAGYIIFRHVFHLTGSHVTSVRCAQLWLFNPITLAVSTRGNAESLMAVLVLGSLHLISRGSVLGFISSGILYGTAVHVKIYPCTYAVAMYLFINRRYWERSVKFSKWRDTLWTLVPTPDTVLFGLSALIFLVFFTGIFYLRYGTTFLQETYFYHLTRRDTRHNFSPYFYMLYLLSTGDGANTLVSLSTFLPQFILMFATALRYHRQLEFACFVQTFIFVSFNKVCTSQYFLWYLCLLPLVVPHLQMGLKQGVALGLSWLVGQGIWLFPAYLLEFQGMDTFKYIWLAGLTFFSINILILLRLIAKFQFKTKEDINKKDS